jgi:Co/Zn/Cd efflux system component
MKKEKRTKMENQEKSVVVNVNYKLADILRYNMHVAYQSIVSKGMVAVGIILLAILGYKFANRTAPLDLFIAQNIVLIILPIFILIATPLKVWKITALQMQNPIFSQGATFKFYPNIIHLSVQETSEEVPWATYCFIKETKKDFRFFVDKVQAQLLPKHGMSHEQIQDLRAIIRTANPDELIELHEH